MNKVTITQLSEEVVNKIAAGEVIERPASVVKELVENALDAGATRIVVDLQRAGKELIKVSDNGCGMSKEDAQLCIMRHATSKIRTANDLFNIRTLGFRGEALSSIAAVSHFVLMTKKKEYVSGVQLVVSGGNVRELKEIGAADGTTIAVHDLFLNTPVRKKFLKSDGHELRQILDIVTKYALLNPKVSLSLQNNGKSVFSSEATGELLSTIASVYGNTIAKELLEVSVVKKGLKITGYLSKPTITRSDKSQQTFFVNGRAVTSPVIDKAFHEAYHSVLFIHRYPTAVLHIEVDPAFVDVNVHPTKKEVKFEQSNVVYRFVYHAVRDVLQKENLIPLGEIKSPFNYQSFSKYSFEPSSQTMLQSASLSAPLLVREQELSNDLISESSKFPPIKLLGQIHKTFFVAETPGGLLIIDQHIVQERVLYERFMRQYMNNAVKTQAMLEAAVVDFSAADAAVVQEHLDNFEKLGFIIESFGGNSFLVRSVPLIFGKAQPKELLVDLIDQFRSGKRDALSAKVEEIVTRMSCRYSVKAGDSFTLPQMHIWLRELDQCNLAYHCPHGRPIFVKLSVNELEKMFMRK
jgi:DNA mismatch repair protein MutL